MKIYNLQLKIPFKRPPIGQKTGKRLPFSVNFWFFRVRIPPIGEVWTPGQGVLPPPRGGFGPPKPPETRQKYRPPPGECENWQKKIKGKQPPFFEVFAPYGGFLGGPGTLPYSIKLLRAGVGGPLLDPPPMETPNWGGFLPSKRGPSTPL